MAANKASFIPQDYKPKKQYRKSDGFFSSAMGVHPNQVADELTRHPNWKFNNEGQLWIENWSDQKKKAKALGMLV